MPQLSLLQDAQKSVTVGGKTYRLPKGWELVKKSTQQGINFHFHGEYTDHGDDTDYSMSVITDVKPQEITLYRGMVINENAEKWKPISFPISQNAQENKRIAGLVGLCAVKASQAYAVSGNEKKGNADMNTCLHMFDIPTKTQTVTLF